MKNVLKLAKESEQTLLEIFAQVPGSFEEYTSLIRKALQKNPPAEAQNASHCWLEGCIGEFPEKVIFEAVFYDNQSGEHTREYIQANVALSETDQVVFSDVKTVDIKAAITAKNEMEKLADSNKPENIKQSEFNETVEATVEMKPLTEAEAQQGQKRTGSVTIAQKANTKNKNNRVYPKAVLKEAVEIAQQQISEYGGMMMDSRHRTDDKGNNLTDLRETVAVIKQIEFNEESGTVSLPEIEFVGTQAGKDLMALLESGAKLQVSQRANGTSHEVWDPQTNESHQEINWLRFVGFDFVPGGRASVSEAHFESKNESASSEESAEAGLTETTEQGSQASSNGGGAQRSPNGDGGSPTPQTAGLNEEDRSLLQNVHKQLQNQQTSLTETQAEMQAQMNEETRKTQIAHLKSVGTPLLKEEVDSLTRFNDEQKQMILDEIVIERFFNNITDVYSEAAILQAVRPAIHKEAERLDKVIASAQLENLGFPVDQETGLANRQRGQTRVAVLHENMPGAELHNKVVSEAIKQIKEMSERDMYYMADDHPSIDHLNEVMSWFWQDNYHAVKNENTLAQSDIGGRIASIAAMVIPTVWRMMTAFEVVDTEPMPNRLLDKKIRIQAQGNNTNLDVVSLYANLDPGENGNIAEVSSKYLNYPLYATRQALRTKITSEARATAKNTPMQPMIDAVIDLVLDIRNRIDMGLWWQHITHGLHQETGQVTAWEPLSRVGSTHTWESDNKAWIPLAWDKTDDDNGNPTSARFEGLTPAIGESGAPTGLGTQGIELQTTHTTAVALLYGTDYTVDFQSGRITLTAAGETKRTTGSAANIQAKYTYSKNVNFWSMTPSSGVNLSAHLLNLRRAVGQRRVAVADRNWKPNCVGFNYDIEDLITHGDRFTDLGGSAAEALNMMNQVVNYAGLDPIKSSALPSGWIPVFQKGAVCHGVHIPWAFEPPITNENTGVKYILGEQYSASDVPVNDKIGIVAVLP